ncbi:MAG: peptide-methionine (S)-S-oxide reductase MsrA [Hellea sp.]|nr:peptide-methionine (S)-S-oxide reductase MsrA [Hellea sp.]
MKKIIWMTGFLLLAGCAEAQINDAAISDDTAAKTTDTAILAGGCFWCVEADFEKLPGVLKAVSGYTGGTTVNPTYKDVTYKETGHYEAVEITFNPSKVSYEEILDHYWVNIDPTDPYGQFCDKGSSYRTAIFARPDQMEIAEKSKAHVINVKPFDADILTPVLEASTFYTAEKYHQDYYKKNESKYNYYRRSCGRDKRLEKLWGK